MEVVKNLYELPFDYMNSERIIALIQFYYKYYFTTYNIILLIIVNDN